MVGTRKSKVLDVRTLGISIPIEILQDRDVSALEAIVVYLRDEQKLTYAQIAQLLKRNDRTIWTTYKRAIEKRPEA